MSVEDLDAAAIEEIERILRVAQSQARDLAPVGGAIWFCACITSVAPSPTWVIQDGQRRGALTSQRLPDPVWSPGPHPRMVGKHLVDVVGEEQIVAGGHVEPGGLRDWMRGRGDVGGSVVGDVQALARLRELCRSVPA